MAYLRRSETFQAAHGRSCRRDGTQDVRVARPAAPQPAQCRHLAPEGLCPRRGRGGRFARGGARTLPRRGGGVHHRRRADLCAGHAAGRPAVSDHRDARLRGRHPFSRMGPDAVAPHGVCVSRAGREVSLSL